ncbi:hypothetical protein SAMN04489713_1365 [Actinomadura madurae]|uniref:Uncharacterized protein n=1 Tax=Actinomadura madurae TaxID=1993 RepID=A0A1I5YQJ8_9ACTN|nr:hypothetical protein [Actinomadura madurae]SFQ46422.1 hypothetical protein SAMN04489713_1365 [Actinomadura madurae]
MAGDDIAQAILDRRDVLHPCRSGSGRAGPGACGRISAEPRDRCAVTDDAGPGDWTDSLLKASGTYTELPVDEGLVCESGDSDALLDGPLARARTAELYGVEPARLPATIHADFCVIPAFSDWWSALGASHPGRRT